MVDGINPNRQVRSLFSREEDFGLADLLVGRARECGGLGVDERLLRDIESVAQRLVPVGKFSQDALGAMDEALRRIHSSLREAFGEEGMFSDISRRARMPTFPPPPPPASSEESRFDYSQATLLEVIQHEYLRTVRLCKRIDQSVEGVPYRAFVRGHLLHIGDLLSGLVKSHKSGPQVMNREVAGNMTARLRKDLDAVDMLSTAGLNVLQNFVGEALTDIAVLLYLNKIGHGSRIHSISDRLRTAMDTSMCTSDEKAMEFSLKAMAFGLMAYHISKNMLVEPIEEEAFDGSSSQLQKTGGAGARAGGTFISSTPLALQSGASFVGMGVRMFGHL